MPKKNELFEDDDNFDSKLTINKDYANSYENWRRKEELNKAKARYGDLDLNEESSSSEDEEIEFDEHFEKDFFKTLSALKTKDPKIYNQNVQFFNDEYENDKSNKKTKKEKPLLLKDYERDLILKHNGNVESDEDNEKRASPTYVEEQKQLKDSFKKILENDSDNDNDKYESGFLKKREKTKEEQEKEEKDFEKWLKGQKDNINDDKFVNEVKPLKDYWNNPQLKSNEKFLRDYILNKRFLDRNDDEYIPTYDEIVHDSDENLSEDEKNVFDQEEFELIYNNKDFDHEFLKRYPRTVEHTLRKKDDKRKRKRAKIRERKEQEKMRKKEELQRLKALKRKEIEEKIEKLNEITGNSISIGFTENDLEGDFDPGEHDKRMQQLFNDEFYQSEDVEDQKSSFPDIDEELEIERWDKWNNHKSQDEFGKNEPHCEDADFNMDCDFDPVEQKRKEKKIEHTRRGKRKTKLAEILSNPKPKFDPKFSSQTFTQYVDEYYSMDYEDLIGDLPCRFKYRKCIPNDFGLSVEEILMANDKELNRWCSLKKAVQIRPEHVEKYDIDAYKKKSKNVDLKKKFLPSLFVETEKTSKVVENDNLQDKNIVNKKKKLEKNIEDINVDHKKVINNLESCKNDETKLKKKIKNNKSKMNENLEKSKKKKDKNGGSSKLNKRKWKNSKENLLSRKKIKNDTGQNLGINISDSRLKAYGIRPKKFKNKLKYNKS